MLELSLFSGAGGGLLASRLMGWRTIGYVEKDDYCQHVISARIRDGQIPLAPIFGDVEAFVREGYAERYFRMVDCVSAGFPCQPFSVANSKRGVDTSKNMWPETAAIIRAVRPRYAFMENVPGLLSSGYFGTVLSDLAEIGYDARWCVLGAADCGAPHLRKRLWILGTAQGTTSYPQRPELREQWQRDGKQRHEPGAAELGDNGQSGQVANAHSKQEPQPEGREPKKRGRTGNGGEQSTDAPSNRREEQRGAGADETKLSPVKRGGWWATEPDVGRVAHGVAYRVDRLRSLGNGQVPIVAATAWRILTEGLT